jgi:hypothetical protein
VFNNIVDTPEFIPADELQSEQENSDVKSAFSSKDCYAKSRFSSLDEALDRHYGYKYEPSHREQVSVDVEIQTTWFIALMSCRNPTIGKALVKRSGYRPATLPFPVEYPEVKEVVKYEPRVFSKPTLVRTTVTEKIGRNWRKRSYWRLAGIVTIGRVDQIRCDGPDYPMKDTYVPANYRRAKGLDIGRKERANNLVGQQKRARIATVPIAIRFARAVELRKRLDHQASVAFEQKNMSRYDVFDARAARVTDWLVHVAQQFPDLAFKRPEKEATTDKQKMAIAFKKADKLTSTSNHVSRSDKNKSRKLHVARLERQAKWVNKIARKR